MKFVQQTKVSRTIGTGLVARWRVLIGLWHLKQDVIDSGRNASAIDFLSVLYQMNQGFGYYEGVVNILAILAQSKEVRFENDDADLSRRRRNANAKRN